MIKAQIEEAKVQIAEVVEHAKAVDHFFTKRQFGAKTEKNHDTLICTIFWLVIIGICTAKNYGYL